MSVLGCAPASLHPTYDYSIQDSQADCRAPLRYFRVSCSPISGGSQRRSGRHRETQSNTQRSRRRLASTQRDCFTSACTFQGIAKTKLFDACEPQKPVAARPFATRTGCIRTSSNGKGSWQYARKYCFHPERKKHSMSTFCLKNVFYQPRNSAVGVIRLLNMEPEK